MADLSLLHFSEEIIEAPTGSLDGRPSGSWYRFDPMVYGVGASSGPCSLEGMIQAMATFWCSWLKLGNFQLSLTQMGCSANICRVDKTFIILVSGVASSCLEHKG